ncbi:glycosyltransferase [Comamonas aquatica]|nr:glycosyltransferase [Comamonas aquatica]
MSIIFIGGFFPGNIRNEIEDKSKGVIQYAAHAFQENIIKGLDELSDSGISIVNLPFIGSYPLRYNDICYHGVGAIEFSTRSRLIDLDFFNLSLIKHLSRFFSLIKYLLKININKSDDFVIYSMHLPFLAAVAIIKKIKKNNNKIYLMVPDLPEYMSDSKNIAYLFFKKIDKVLINFFLKSVDGFILLTEAMGDALALEKNKYIIVEGVAKSVFDLNAVANINEHVIFYSGTLAGRYGVRELIDAFNMIESDRMELWICGDGDAKMYVQSAAKKNPRIKYLGQIPIERVHKLQSEAAVLINPRMPNDDYTKYSFPSKIIEYMASGRPLIMHRLPGVPAEYYEYCFSPRDSSVDALKCIIEDVFYRSRRDLDEVGLRAKNFISNNKTSTHQALRILKFMKRV